MTIICAGGLASLLAGWNASEVSALSPSEVVALRFPDARNGTRTDVGAARIQAAYADQRDEQIIALFNPNPTIPLQPATAVTPTYVTASTTATPVVLSPQPTTPAHDVRTRPEPKVAAVRSRPAAPPARRPGAVLSDGQIASIKTRLNLTPEQQQMWPAVEQALRNLSYASNSERATGHASRTRTATVDPGSEEVQRLKSAAFPLIMSFSNEQKRELRILAHVAGLEKLAAQF